MAAPNLVCIFVEGLEFHVGKYFYSDIPGSPKASAVTTFRSIHSPGIGIS